VDDLRDLGHYWLFSKEALLEHHCPLAQSHLAPLFTKQVKNSMGERL